MNKLPYDALLVVSFGGPDKPDDVMPFLENVTRGRNIPRARLEEVAEHYYHFGGKSPINEQNLALIEALRQAIAKEQWELPVYFGNRNWHPLLPDTLRQMREAGVERALCFFTSAFSSYSGCRQYRENLQAAQQEVGEGAPVLDKLRNFYNHPGFLNPQATRLRHCLEGVGDQPAAVIFTAHSIPNSMADNCRYVAQLQEACGLVASMAGVQAWELAYQSRSGSPHQPWLEPDVNDRVRELAAQGIRQVVVVPIGFISDHMEVLYDLDTELADICRELGQTLHRLPTVGTDPEFVSMIVELVAERCGLRQERRALGSFGASHDVCPADCCRPGAPAGRPPAAAAH